MGSGGAPCLPEAGFCKREEVPTLLAVHLLHTAVLICNRYSILPAISMEGILECMIVEGSYTTDLFTIFIKDLLEKMQPYPAPNSVIIMDNCAIHKAPEIRDMIEARFVVSIDSFLVITPILS